MTLNFKPIPSDIRPWKKTRLVPLEIHDWFSTDKVLQLVDFLQVKKDRLTSTKIL